MGYYLVKRNRQKQSFYLGTFKTKEDAKIAKKFHAPEWNNARIMKGVKSRKKKIWGGL